MGMILLIVIIVFAIYTIKKKQHDKTEYEKSKFFNPIIQNKGHMKCLQQFLEYESPLPFYSYIVFSDRCTLKDITLISRSHFVIKRHNILPAVQSNSANVGIQLSPQKIDALYEKLYPLTQIDETQKSSHVENVQRKQQTTTANMENIRCPRCNGILVSRIATKGYRQGKRFLGCSNYPKCKYIKNIPTEFAKGFEDFS